MRTFFAADFTAAAQVLAQKYSCYRADCVYEQEAYLRVKSSLRYGRITKAAKLTLMNLVCRNKINTARSFWEATLM